MFGGIVLIGYEERFILDENKHSSFKVFVHKESSHLHWHKYIEILYILKGRVLVHVNAQSMVAEPGTLFFINTMEQHYTDFVNDEEHQILCIQFDANILYTLGEIGYETEYITALLNRKIKYPVCIDVKNKNNILVILEELLREGEERRIGYEMNIKADFFKLIVWYLRETEDFDGNSEFSHIDNEERMKLIFDYVNQNYMLPITTAEAAQYVFLSYTYFCKMFKTNTGCTFMEYLNNVRLVEAKKLLNMDISISNVALKTGFKDQNYFSRLFKRKFNVTPSKYKKNSRLRRGNNK